MQRPQNRRVRSAARGRAIAFATTLLWSLLVGVLWIRSGFVQEYLTWRGKEDILTVTDTRAGGVLFGYSAHPADLVFGDLSRIRGLTSMRAGLLKRLEYGRSVRYPEERAFAVDDFLFIDAANWSSAQFVPDRSCDTLWSFLGIRWETVGTQWPHLSPSGIAQMGFHPHQVDTYYLLIPFWLLFVAGLGFPSYYFIRRYRIRRAINRGVCFECGYDLRASEDRCPECGTPVPERMKLARTQSAQTDAGPSPADATKESPCTRSNSTPS